MQIQNSILLARGEGVRPAPRLGILGGGQLAKMTAMAASKFGCEVVVLERSADFPAQSLDTHALVGDWNDPAEALKLAALVDVVTLENEFVNTDALAALSEKSHRLWPSLDTIRLVQDKFRQKEVLLQAGLAVARFAEASTMDAVRKFGFPCILKKRLNSYDGKGNASVLTETDLSRAWAQLDGDRNALYVEELCDFTMELAIIIARGANGESVRYPIVETVNRDHICHITKMPAAVEKTVAVAAANMAEKAVMAVGGVGSFGLEMFLLKDGRLFVNEIAPRVHNTGHYTIEACVCSQFENHVRAVLGWPLGSTEPLAPAAVMINLLGRGPGSGSPVGIEDALRVAGANIHVYGKSKSARGRKMGHVTALGATVEEALDIARRAASCIQFGGEA